MIDSMLRVKPQERVDVADVVVYCEKHIALLVASQHTSSSGNLQVDGGMKRISRMDPVLIMDDIIEKLHLLDYIRTFCPTYGRKPISRTYFAMKCETEQTNVKVRYFVELSYWLMSLGFQ